MGVAGKEGMLCRVSPEVASHEDPRDWTQDGRFVVKHFYELSPLDGFFWCSFYFSGFPVLTVHNEELWAPFFISYLLFLGIIHWVVVCVLSH